MHLLSHVASVYSIILLRKDKYQKKLFKYYVEYEELDSDAEVEEEEEKEKETDVAPCYKIHPIGPICP